MSNLCRPHQRRGTSWRSSLTEAREDNLPTVHPGGTVITRSGGDVRWWTWAGFRANATLTATLSGLTDQRFDDEWVQLRSDLTPQMWRAGTADAADRLSLFLKV
jgi:ATP-dependent helicase Lhr and Lhr-like helicase